MALAPLRDSYTYIANHINIYQYLELAQRKSAQLDDKSPQIARREVLCPRCDGVSTLKK
jgi:hypothetical protein